MHRLLNNVLANAENRRYSCIFKWFVHLIDIIALWKPSGVLLFKFVVRMRNTDKDIRHYDVAIILNTTWINNLPWLLEVLQLMRPLEVILHEILHWFLVSNIALTVHGYLIIALATDKRQRTLKRLTAEYQRLAPSMKKSVKRWN